MNLSLKTSWAFIKSVAVPDLYTEFTNIRQWFNDHDNGNRAWSSLNSSGTTIVGVQKSAAPSTQQPFSTVNIWVDESGNNLTFQVAYSNGTVKNGTVALV